MKNRDKIKAMQSMAAIDKKYQPKHGDKAKVEVVYDIPKGCQFDHQREMERGKIKKQHIKWGDK